MDQRMRCPGWRAGCSCGRAVNPVQDSMGPLGQQPLSPSAKPGGVTGGRSSCLRSITQSSELFYESDFKWAFTLMNFLKKSIQTTERGSVHPEDGKDVGLRWRMGHMYPEDVFFSFCSNTQL